MGEHSQLGSRSNHTLTCQHQFVILSTFVCVFRFYSYIMLHAHPKQSLGYIKRSLAGHTRNWRWYLFLHFGYARIDQKKKCYASLMSPNIITTFNIFSGLECRFKRIFNVSSIDVELEFNGVHMIVNDPIRLQWSLICTYWNAFNLM